jgi:hypothetical protein
MANDEWQVGNDKKWPARDVYMKLLMLKGWLFTTEIFHDIVFCFVKFYAVQLMFTIREKRF